MVVWRSAHVEARWPIKLCWLQSGVPLRLCWARCTSATLLSRTSTRSSNRAGARMQCDGTDDAEVHHRMAIAQTTFGSLSSIWTDHRLLRALKLRTYQLAVCSTLTHASEAWTITEPVMCSVNGSSSRCLNIITGEDYLECVECTGQTITLRRTATVPLDPLGLRWNTYIHIFLCFLCPLAQPHRCVHWNRPQRTASSDRRSDRPTFLLWKPPSLHPSYPSGVLTKLFWKKITDRTSRITSGKDRPFW